MRYREAARRTRGRRRTRSRRKTRARQQHRRTRGGGLWQEHDPRWEETKAEIEEAQAQQALRDAEADSARATAEFEAAIAAAVEAAEGVDGEIFSAEDAAEIQAQADALLLMLDEGAHAT